MAAVVFNWEVEQGATSTFSLRYLDTENNPIDLSGYSGRGQVRLRMGDANPLCDLLVNIPNPTDGVIVITLTAAALADQTFRAKSYSDKVPAVYDVEIYTPTGITYRVVNGTMFISPEVTKN